MRYARHSGNALVVVCGKRSLDHLTGFRVGWNDRSDKNEAPPFFGTLAQFARSQSWITPHILAPDITAFTGNVVSEADLDRCFYAKGVSIYWGCAADGVTIPPGYTAFFPTGDCPTIVAHHYPSQKLIAAHAGLKSLLPEGKVVKNVLASFDAKIPREEIFVHVICSIAPTHFVYSPHHPLYGEGNRKILDEIRAIDKRSASDEGEINLYRLIHSLLRQNGVPAQNIDTDGLDTFSDADLWSHVRGEQGRNGIFVINKKPRDASDSDRGFCFS
ncbi:MAG: laccase domain-containing protein [Parcubacteria group bacterium]|nr:laccase domain-containing protein [Parcubacteria group bacterium]